LNSVLLEKLTGSQIVKKFAAYSAVRKFITAFKVSVKIHLILFSHPRPDLPSVLFPSDSPTTHLYAPVLSTICAVITAWRVFRLQMKERTPYVKGSCEHIKYAVVDSRQWVVIHLRRWERYQQLLSVKNAI
jgi:hypothetical protein